MATKLNGDGRKDHDMSIGKDNQEAHTLNSVGNGSALTPMALEVAAPAHLQIEAEVLQGSKQNEWSTLTKARLFRNFYSAVALCLVSFPFVLIMVLSFNQAAPEEILTYPGSIMTSLVGFANVLIYSNGRLLFRTFTGFLYPILEKSVESYGKEGLATISLYVTVLTFIGVFFRLHALIRFIPSFLFDAFKTGAGIFLIFADMYSLINIKSRGSDTNLAGFTKDLIANWQHAKVAELTVSLIVGGLTFLAQKKFPKVPWPALTFVFGILYGYFAVNHDAFGSSRAKLLRDVAPQDFNKGAPSLFQVDFSLLRASITGLRHPQIAAYGFGVLILIFFEVSIAISVDEDRFDHSIHKSSEFLSLAFSNAVCLVLGILPQSVPIGRQKFVIGTGADHKIMHLFCIGIMLLLYFFCFELTSYMPICAMKGLNILVSLNLVDFRCILAYGRYSKIYPLAMICLMAAMLFMNLAWCILASVGIYVLVYILTVGRAGIEMIESADGRLDVTLSGRYAFTCIPQLVSRVRASKSSSVRIDFGDIAWHEVNYLRHYCEDIQSIAESVSTLALKGIKRPGSQIAERLPTISKYLV